jgi:hypothetical protein
MTNQVNIKPFIHCVNIYFLFLTLNKTVDQGYMPSRTDNIIHSVTNNIFLVPDTMSVENM